MNIIVLLLPAALFLGLCGLGAFFWAIRSDQFEDLDGAANRILRDDRPPAPTPPRRKRDGR